MSRFMTEPTPTLEEYFWSHFNLMSYDELEDVLYKTIDLYLLFGPLMAKAIYNRLVGGMAWSAASYAAGSESWGLYRFMTKPGRALGMVKKHPVIFVLAALMSIRPDEKITHNWEYDRIARARSVAMGHRGQSDPHGTSDDYDWSSNPLPYYENPAGERIWYSFHPERI